MRRGFELGAARSFRAPGRVNLIGDHTDYNEGFVLPLAIDLECLIAARPTRDKLVRVRSLDAGEADGDDEVALPSDGSLEPLQLSPGWGRYMAGVLRALADRGRRPVGMEALISSSVPLGAGLSSSAALEVACAIALCDIGDFELPPLELALACQEAEQIATGVPCGIMDQLTSAAGRSGCALLIDCRSLDVRPVPLPPELTVLVVHSGISRALADSAYAERRRTCEQVAKALGLSALRDASPEQVAREQRARHVVSENARVLEAVEALGSNDFPALGRLLSASHASLRDDYEVSTPELDALAAALEAAGALGARLTGAGFGGCVVALADSTRADQVAAQGAARYRAKTGRQPTTFVCHAVDGAGPVLAGELESELTAAHRAGARTE